MEVGNGVNGSKERSIQPSTTLKDKFSHGIWHIRFSSGRFDILENPMAVSLGHQLKTENSIFGKVHVGLEKAGAASTVQCLAQEVLFQRPFSVFVVLEGNVSVGRESTRQHRNKPKGGFERLVQNVAHLILEILGCNQWVQQILAAGTQHGLNFTASATAHGFQVECLPQVIDGIAARASTSIEKDADVGIQDTAKSLEEPSVRVDLLLILLLQAEEHLHGLSSVDKRDDVVFELEMGLGSVLVNVCGNILVVDLLFCNTLLVNAHTRQKSLGSRVNFSTAVADNTNNNLLPSLLAPGFTVGAIAHIFNVLEHTNHGPSKQDVIFVVHGNNDEEFSVAGFTEKLLSQCKVFIVEV